MCCKSQDLATSLVLFPLGDPGQVRRAQLAAWRAPTTAGCDFPSLWQQRVFLVLCALCQHCLCS